MTAKKTVSEKKAEENIVGKSGMKADVFNMQGKKTGSLSLPEKIFGVQWNDALMHQVVTSMQDNARTRVAHTKDRGDVRGGGKKPWQQKGTGRARHGSIRSPIWRGGGVTHGPRREKVYARAIPRGMRSKALAMALSQKLRNGKIVLVDSFAFDAPKTAVARKTLVSLGNALGEEKFVGKRTNAALIALSDPRASVTKSFRNIGNVEVKSVRDLNPVSVLQHSYLVIENPDAAVSILSHRIGQEKTLSNEQKARATEQTLLLEQRGDQ
jgi:large subunit ribosomal protein L4